MPGIMFPDDHKYLTFLKKVFRHEFRKNGFRRISTPILENGVLRETSERGIMRAYLDNEIAEQIQPVYYYYMGRFFEGGNEGYVIGGEIIGENDPILDVIMIYVTYCIFNKIGLKDSFEINLNSNGIEKEKVKFREELVNFYSDKKHLLSEKSLELLETNPMLILPSEDEDEKILATSAPQMFKFLKKDSKAHFLKVKEYLDILNIPYNEDNTLIGKKSYNTNTIWNFIEKETGKIISSGSRYNNLGIEEGNPKEIPAAGFKANTGYLIEMIKRKGISIRNKDAIDLFIVQLGDEAKKVVFPISIKAREAGINTVVSLGTPSIKEQMLKAQRSGAKFIVIVGVMEARNGIFQVRDSEAGTQEEVKKEELLDYIIGKVGENALDFYSPEKDLVKK